MYCIVGIFHMVLISHIPHAHSACENKNYKNLNDQNFLREHLTSLHVVKIEYRQLMLCQVFEWPTQRLLISHKIEAEANTMYRFNIALSQEYTVF